MTTSDIVKAFREKFVILQKDTCRHDCCKDKTYGYISSVAKHEDVESFILSTLETMARESLEVVPERDHAKGGINTNHEKDEMWCCCECHDDSIFNEAHSALKDHFTKAGLMKE